MIIKGSLESNSFIFLSLIELALNGKYQIHFDKLLKILIYLRLNGIGEFNTI